MKIRLLLSLLFVIATTVAQLHELTHIEHNDGSSCSVCVVDDHLVGADINVDFKEVVIFHFEHSLAQNLLFNTHIKSSSNQNRAPPASV